MNVILNNAILNKEEIQIQFIKKHGSLISNILVVVLVLLAIYSKIHDGQMDTLFNMKDIYLVVGAFIGLVVLRFMSKRKTESSSINKTKK